MQVLFEFIGVVVVIWLLLLGLTKASEYFKQREKDKHNADT